MKSFITEITAIDPVTNELTLFSGDIVNVVNWQHAEMILQTTERGYMSVIRELESEIMICDFTLN